MFLHHHITNDVGKTLSKFKSKKPNITSENGAFTKTLKNSIFILKYAFGFLLEEHRNSLIFLYSTRLNALTYILATI